jgi:isohexenylglutaconyl-CoA hydratase
MVSGPAGYANITLERDGAVARLTFNRPDRRNALTHGMMLELEDAFGRVRDDAGCRVLVLRGAGGHFCAGGDLDAMADMPPRPANGCMDPLIPAYRQFGDALLALNTLPQATIAVVEGSAVGGGFGMACCSDVVVLHETARFGMPEPKWGFIPSQILPFVVRRMGEGAARDLAVTGRVIDASEAHRLGLGRHLCRNTAELNRTVKSVLDDVLKLEPHALAAAKRLVMACSTNDDRSVLDDAAGSLVGLLRQPQASEGIQAFKAKRPPPWQREG